MLSVTTASQNQIPVAMDEGANVGITTHEERNSFPMPLGSNYTRAEFEEQEVPAAPEVLSNTGPSRQ